MAAPFHFVCLDSKSKNILSEPTLSEWLRKWSMKEYLRIQRYSFNEPFQLYQKQDFAEAFFKDPNVVSTLQCFSSGARAPIGTGRPVDTVSVQRVPCSLTSTALFRRLAKIGVVRGDGEDLIAPCAETQIGDIIINDRWRRILLDEEDEDWDVFDHGERSELLFQLVRLLAVGGRWCQYEDTTKPYLEAARAIYKDLVSVEKDPTNGQPVVRSLVFKVVARDEDGEAMLPVEPDHPQEAAFLCVDPVRRTVAVLTHHYGQHFYD